MNSNELVGLTEGVFKKNKREKKKVKKEWKK